jgi:hypothetical protein
VLQVSENTEIRFDNDFELPYADTAELKSNQSVRATFRGKDHTGAEHQEENRMKKRGTLGEKTCNVSTSPTRLFALWRFANGSTA